MKYISISISIIIFYLMMGIEGYISPSVRIPIIVGLGIIAVAMILLQLIKKAKYGINLSIVFGLLSIYLYIWLETDTPISRVGNSKVILVVSVILLFVGIVQG